MVGMGRVIGPGLGRRAWRVQQGGPAPLGLVQGRTQAQIAADEGITPSAVSQSVQKSGVAALVEGLRVLGDGGR